MGSTDFGSNQNSPGGWGGSGGSSVGGQGGMGSAKASQPTYDYYSGAATDNPNSMGNWNTGGAYVGSGNQNGVWDSLGNLIGGTAHAENQQSLLPGFKGGNYPVNNSVTTGGLSPVTGYGPDGNPWGPSPPGQPLGNLASTAAQQRIAQLREQVMARRQARTAARSPPWVGVTPGGWHTGYGSSASAGKAQGPLGSGYDDRISQAPSSTRGLQVPTGGPPPNTTTIGSESYNPNSGWGGTPGGGWGTGGWFN